MQSTKRSAQSKGQTLMLGPDDVTSCIDIASVIDAIEDAFIAYEDGDAKMPPKSYVDLPKFNGDFRAMPAHVRDSSGTKWVNVHPDNPEDHGLPTVMGTVIFSDPGTGFPLAIMDGTTLTRYRTGGVAGVATRHLASDDASTLGLLGAGQQAHMQLAAIANETDLERVVVADLSEEAIEQFIADNSHRNFEIVEGTPEDVGGCDVISTTTPSKNPILRSEWIKDGAHINAIGADAEGKRELATDLVKSSAVVVDDWEQCAHSGEINVPVSVDEIDRADVFADLSEIVAGSVDAPGERDITIFDSTGLAIQDIATARLIYAEAESKDVGVEFELVST